MTSKWRPIISAELSQILTRDLAVCSDADRAFFAKIRIEPRKVRFDRGMFSEDVFVVGQEERRVLFFDDIEDGFEVGVLDTNEVIRGAGASQFDLRQALYQFKRL